MVDLTITVTNVALVSGGSLKQVTGGEAIDAGEVVYRDPADNTWKLCDADAAATAEAMGIAMSDCEGDGKPFLIAPPGSTINCGSTTTAGIPYVVSAEPGKIAPYSDLGSGDFPCFVFWGTGTAVVEFRPHVSSVAI